MKKFLSLLVLGGLFISASAVCAPANYVIEAQKSAVSFEAVSTGHGFSGRSNDLKGRMVFDPAVCELVQKAQIEIPIKSMTTGIVSRDHAMQHMFETDRFPEIVFLASAVSRVSDGEQGREVYKVRGTLTVHGIQREVEFTAWAVHKNEETVVSAEIPLRTDWFGLKTPSFLGVVKVNPEVKVNIKAVWKKDYEN